eukprot:GHVR01084989.1.p2 GENE.GHVR01084989.1~~GHVR01084989.1.p2  ORF type:complete len:171 (-),score=51.26 GHVR01084989.1:148-660(-)
MWIGIRAALDPQFFARDINKPYDGWMNASQLLKAPFIRGVLNSPPDFITVGTYFGSTEEDASKEKKDICEPLINLLNKIKIRRMFVGHERMNDKRIICDDHVYMIDTKNSDSLYDDESYEHNLLIVKINKKINNVKDYYDNKDIEYIYIKTHTDHQQQQQQGRAAITNQK